jgi:hypothetical protein
MPLRREYCQQLINVWNIDYNIEDRHNGLSNRFQARSTEGNLEKEKAHILTGCIN